MHLFHALCSPQGVSFVLRQVLVSQRPHFIQT